MKKEPITITLPEEADVELWILDDIVRKLSVLSENQQMRAAHYIFNRFGTLSGERLAARIRGEE